eukprot:scaffold4270_cov166-Amphora_coffeaeformis.AAC.4
MFGHWCASSVFSFPAIPSERASCIMGYNPFAMPATHVPQRSLFMNQARELFGPDGEEQTDLSASCGSPWYFTNQTTSGPGLGIVGLVPYYGYDLLTTSVFLCFTVGGCKANPNVSSN